MTELPPRKRVRDTELMRALAHPLRAALLDYLTAIGPRTASECAEAVDSSASNCSWHLRQLAQFGLVERTDGTDGTDGRERPWRATQVGLELGELDADPAVRGAQLAVVGTTLAQEQLLTQRFLDTTDQLDAAWRDAGSLSSYGLTVTAEELKNLVEAVDALIRPYISPIRTDAPAAARHVHVGFRAFLRIEADGKPSPR